MLKTNKFFVTFLTKQICFMKIYILKLFLRLQQQLLSKRVLYPETEKTVHFLFFKYLIVIYC